MNRPSREEYYMAIAILASTRSTCLSHKIGAVIVKNDNPISFGYNGPARGIKHCEELGGCIRRSMPNYKSGKYLEFCPASHAEQNAIAFAAYHGISTAGATIYVSAHPCKDCLNSIINAGIKKVIYYDDYFSEISKNIAKEADIEIEKFEGKLASDILSEFNYIDIPSLFKRLDNKEKVEIVKKLIELLDDKDKKKIIK